METLSKIEYNLEANQISQHLYSNLTLPEIDWGKLTIRKYQIFYSIVRDRPSFQKTLVHELGHIINLSNMPQNHDLFSLIPYESAINELGGEFFEFLYFFPDFIAEIYKIHDPQECEKIARYNRLNDLMSKRFLAIQYKTFTKCLQNPKFFKINTTSTQKNIKKLLKRHLFLHSKNVKLFSPNVIHQLDYLRGLLLIQEPFYQSCINSQDKYSNYKSKLNVFFKHLYFQPFDHVLKYFAGNTSRLLKIN